MKAFIAITAASLMLAGCGTITRGSNDTWVVETTPPGATVSTSNGYECQSTPCAIKMPRRSEFVATIERDGYETVTVNVTHQVSSAGGASMAGNVLVGGLIGAAVDAGSGAMNDLVPNPVRITLVPLSN
jgi:membrane-bound inhibitor of C-type lysozyme